MYDLMAGKLTIKPLYLLILTVVCGVAVPVQGAGPQTPPKVALVLSGGGARGAAHVGVLRVFEQKGIPVDCIAGTSFGALVGGLYSVGYSADEIAREVTERFSKGFLELFPPDNNLHLWRLLIRRTLEYLGIEIAESS